MNHPSKVPISQQAQRAREHYEELANIAHHWSSIIPQAINAWEREMLANTACTGRLIAVGGLCGLAGIIIGWFVFSG